MLLSKQKQQELVNKVALLSKENAQLKSENTELHVKNRQINKSLDKAIKLWTDKFTFAQVIVPQKVRQTLLNIKNGDNPDTFV